jgi:hypothetical protein
MTIRLPDRPGRYAFGPDLPAGRINVQQLDGGVGFTLARVIGGVTWAPLDAQDNPAWLTWSTQDAATAWMEAAAPEDHPHWGAALV